MSTHRNLNARQLRFAREYAIDLNASAAARRSGYSAASGCRLTEHPGIKRLLGEIWSARLARSDFKAKLTLDTLLSIAFANIATYRTHNPLGADRWKRLDELTEKQRMAVRYVTKSGRPVLYDKIKALDVLCGLVPPSANDSTHEAAIPSPDPAGGP